MFQLVKLHENVHLIDKCLPLLNGEWPRDEDFRMRSINKSSDSFPVCLALVDTEQNVFGYVKVRSELPFNKSIFLESLVIEKSNRSKGLGRILIEKVGKFAKDAGFTRLTLTCHEDKEGFYLKTGFSRVHEKSSNQPSQQQTESTMSDASQPLSPVPPPPPMPSLTGKVGVNANILMFKDL